MIDTIVSIVAGIVIFGVFFLSTRIVHDSRMDALEAERQRQAMKYHNY